tara:strand:+ start:2181 stop:2369 length:189 start_codon:yes stop_codon:yes gene_type:complete
LLHLPAAFLHVPHLPCEERFLGKGLCIGCALPPFAFIMRCAAVGFGFLVLRVDVGSGIKKNN